MATPERKVALVGPSEEAIATLAGYLAYKCGGIDLKGLQELEAAGINDKKDIPRFWRTKSRKLTFETRRYNNIVEDQPEDVKTILLLADIGGSTDDLLETPLDRLPENASIVVAVLDLENAADAEEKMSRVEHSLGGRLAQEKSASKVIFVPITLTGGNILEPSNGLSWFSKKSSPGQGITLIEALDLA